MRQVPAHFIAIEGSLQWLFKNLLSGGRASPPDFDVDRFNLTRRFAGFSLDDLIEQATSGRKPFSSFGR